MRNYRQSRASEITAYNMAHRSERAQYSRNTYAKTRDAVIQRQRRNRSERYALIRHLKSEPCHDCGEQFPPYVMDFDHRDPSGKVSDVSQLVKSGASWERVLDEIRKCDLVCVCCHRLRTYGGFSQQPSEAYKKRRVAVDAVKSQPCVDCRRTLNPCQMDFDHVRGHKVAGITYLVGRCASLEQILEEIRKCDLVCANCHRIRTQSRLTVGQIQSS